MKCIVSTWNKFPAFSHVKSFITRRALLSNMHPSRKQRLFFIFLVMKMAKYRKIRYRSRFRPSCHLRDGQYRPILAGQGDQPSKCCFSHPMALIFLNFHQYPHYINDHHDHHDGTATVEHCHLWAVWEVKMVLDTRMGISRRMHRQ